MAEDYQANSWGAFESTTLNIGIGTETQLSDSGTSALTFNVGSGTTSGIIEYLRFSTYMDHPVPNTVGLVLVSPSGTSIPILNPYSAVSTNPYGDYTNGYRPITTGVAGFYGESMIGDWTIQITDYEADGQAMWLSSAAFTIKFYGR